MKKRNKIIGLIITLLVILSLFFLFFFILNKGNYLTVQEKQWIEDNKSYVVDISVLGGVPALTYDGQGLVFDYLDYVSEQTGLKINTIATTSSIDVQNNYSFKLADKVSKKDILLYTDNYVLVTSDYSLYNSIYDIKDKKIGILEKDLNTFKEILDDSNVFITYKSINELESSEDIDAIIALKTEVTDYLINEQLKIGYEFGINKYYVFRLNGDEQPNRIFRKFYDSWSKKNYAAKYNNSLLQYYYTVTNLSDNDKTLLKSNNYTYGFVENGIIDHLKANKLKGINNIIIKEFSEFSGIPVKFKKYNNYESLYSDFSNANISIMLNYLNDNKFDIQSLQTSNIMDSDLLVVSSIDSNISVRDIIDLKDIKVSTIKNTKLEKYLEDSKIYVDTYDNYDALIKYANKDSALVIDRVNYDYYKTRNLKNYKIDYILGKVNYNYLVNNSDSSVFGELFEFYINYINPAELISNNYSKIAYKTINYILILWVILIIIFLSMIFRIISKVKKAIKKVLESRRNTFTKEDKLKYIDQLTSLKNRAYLNSKVEEWDDSEAYPQCVIVVDLNNVAYINDNHGREEGDKIIRDAANILIQTQLPNTEIIRTDGNEFLVYAVGYKEKEIVSYLRKLSKEFKSLEYGFGAATGYSMIVDELKTFDDAVNEATIEMKQSKEDSPKK